MRRRYIQLKDSPSFKKGTIWEEACDSGNQKFVTINHAATEMFPEDNSAGHGGSSARMVIMNSPEWFEELVVLSIPKHQENKVLDFINHLNRYV